MPRPPRFDVPDVTQHVTQRGNNKIATFSCDEDRRFYKQCLLEHSREEHCDIHAYVLMGNHVHLLLTPRKAGAIPRLMQAVGARYVQQYNRRHDRTGTLWEGRYKASVIGTAEYALNCHRYAATRMMAYRAIVMAPMDSETLEKVRRGDRYRPRKKRAPTPL